MKKLLLFFVVCLVTASIAVVHFHNIEKMYGEINYNPTVPGKTNPNVMQENIKKTICVPGWTKTVRPPTSYTISLKSKLLPPNMPLADFELDHAISLVLGGDPSSPLNLWAQPYKSPYGARQKDTVENYLHREVCANRMTLAEAQKEVLNWVPVYKRISSGFGAVVEAPDLDDN